VDSESERGICSDHIIDNEIENINKIKQVEDIKLIVKDMLIAHQNENL